MSSSVMWVLAVLVLYLAAVIFIGLWSGRGGSKSLEDYAMASRSLGYWVLFSSVFAANISAVTLIGIPGGAYHNGWIMWPYFVTTWAWMTPFLFWLLSNRSWILGQRFNYMTQAEMISNRWNSKGLGVLFSLCLLFYTVPYLMTGVMGAGTALAGLTQGYVPYWVGTVLISAIVCVYLIFGGLRGAAWVNTFQAALFLVAVVVIFFAIASVFGGPSEATRQIQEKFPELMNSQNMSWKVFFSYGIIVALGTAMFPQLFMRMISGRSPKVLKQVTLIFPLAGIITFFTVAYAGMWGRLGVPELVGKASDQILPLVLSQYLPAGLMAILGAAMFAAMMSTMDSQLWGASLIVLKDFILKKNADGTNNISNEKAVTLSRIVTLIIAIISLILAQFQIASIINIVNFAFAGFAVLIFPMIAALHWQRCTKQAVFASIITSQIALIGLQYGFLPQAWNFGFLPGFIAIIVSLVVLVAVTYVTPAPQNEGTKAYFETFALAESDDVNVGSRKKGIAG